jgi:PadR family transcriptional regulator PadR
MDKNKATLGGPRKRATAGDCEGESAPGGQSNIGGGAPKNFLVPYILLLLKGMPVHGYELMQKLTTCGFPTLDAGNIYRMLRQLEKENLVQSEWDTASSGPAKRLYSVTDIGENYLKLHANQLEGYQSLLDQFFSMYTGIFDLYMSPFDKKAPSTKNEKGNK